MFSILQKSAGLVDIGDTLLSISDGENFPGPAQRTRITYAYLKSFFKAKAHSMVALELSRSDHEDAYGLPFMPVPSMIAPFEKIRRTIRIHSGSCTEEKAVRKSEDDSLDIYVDEMRTSLDLGVSCLKVISCSAIEEFCRLEWGRRRGTLLPDSSSFPLVRTLILLGGKSA